METTLELNKTRELIFSLQLYRTSLLIIVHVNIILWSIVTILAAFNQRYFFSYHDQCEREISRLR